MTSDTHKKQRLRGADVLARALHSIGVDCIFSLSGNQIMPLYDALLDVNIRVIHTRHEAAAVFMAEAYAQLGNGPGIALVTAAPGFGNALGALYSARMSESPVIFLSGDSSVSQDGMGAFQEFDQGQAIAPFVKHTERVELPDALAGALKKAADISLSGRAGPVHLSLPFDVLGNSVDDASIQCDITLEPTRIAPDDQQLQQFLQIIDHAHHPLVLAGPSMTTTRNGPLTDRVAAGLNAPVVAMESPRGLNDPALGGLSHVLADVDLVVYLEKRADFMVGFGKPLATATAVVVDDDDVVVQQTRAVHSDTTAFSSNGAAFSDRLVQLFDTVTNSASQSQSRALTHQSVERSAWRTRVESACQTRVRSNVLSGLSPDTVATIVHDWLDKQDNVVLIIDGGEFGQWSQACASSSKRIINGPSGAIGGSIPYALAACVSEPDATIVALMGDGTCGFHLSEFETAARENTPFIAVIGNDSRWNAEHIIQVRDYGEDRAFACELSQMAAYDRVVEALGGCGYQVSDASALTAALDDALASRKPACINVSIEGIAAPKVTVEDISTG